MSFKQDYKKAWRGEEVKVIGKSIVGKSVWEVGLIVEGYAKTMCPVKTGRLAASITTWANVNGVYGKGTMPHGRGANPFDLIEPPREMNQAYVGTPVFYGPYMEYGTVRSEAQPFLRPALELAKGKALTLLLQNGRIQLKEFLRKV
jgi:hypothetical protein